MQLHFPFATLLAGVLVVLSALDAEAVPVTKRKSSVTLPLRRVPQARSDIHPTILLQQHINKGRRRLARMTGREVPSDLELRSALNKRVMALEDDVLAKRFFPVKLPNKGTRNEKRYNRQGVPKKAKAKSAKVNTLAADAEGGKGKLASILDNIFGGDGGLFGGAGGLGGFGGKGKNGAAGATAAAGADGADASGADGADGADATASDAPAATGKGGKKGGKGAGAASAASSDAADATATDAAGTGADATASSDAADATATGKGNGAGTGAAGAGAGAAAAGVTKADAPTADNSLGLDIDAKDVGYLATIQMGTPPTDFSILMDSGSADLWVGAEDCASDQGGDCGNHVFLGAKASSSFKDSTDPFQVTYGTGQVSGNIIQDNINVAGLALDAHTFGVATTESVEFSDDSVPFDGLMGLAQSTLSEQKTDTPPEALAKAGLIDKAIVSYKISRLADNKNDGEITFGDVDPAKFDAKTQVTLDNVSQQGFWEADLDGATVDGQDSGLQGRTAILDTGTTLMVVPEADANAIHSLIDGAQADGQGGFVIPCTDGAAAQTVTLAFGGQDFEIDPRDLAFQDNGDGTCISGITAGNIGAATQWLVGDTFLKNAYFSTNVDDNNLSLAKLV